MKNLLALSTCISLAIFCSCQKQDSNAEQQLAQRKTELDAREKALDEREKALAERTKLVAKPRPVPVPRPRPAQSQRTVPPELQDLVGKMQEIQRGRVPATEQTASPVPSPTPE